MKVLIINTVWTRASTGKIAFGFYKELLAHGHQAILAYGIGEKNTEDLNIRKLASAIEVKLNYIVNEITGYHGRFSPIATKKLIRMIEEFKPDVVQLYNLHGYYINIYRLFQYLKEKEIPIVYGMLDEHPYLGYCCYAYECEQFKSGCRECPPGRFKENYLKSELFNRARETFLLKEEAYANYDKLIFTAPHWVIERARESLLLRDKKLRVVDEYIDTDIVFVPKSTENLRKQLKIEADEKVVLDVAPFSDKRKGVAYFIELANRFKEEKYKFINVGYDGDTESLPSNFIPIPFIEDQEELAEYYSLADLFVCTSLADTMPNVCLDALSCGTPVCGFDITGIAYVAEAPLGLFVQPKDMNGLADIVQQTRKKTVTRSRQCRAYALSRYSPSVYYYNMLQVYQELLEEE